MTKSPPTNYNARVHETGKMLDTVDLLEYEDSDIQLLVPEQDVANPELTILIPALNEEKTITEFVDWCHQGIREAGIEAEILIVNSGNDKTAEIALSKGARVLKAPKRGLGRAYIDGLPYARGKYLILGDADCTYDFREVAPFIEKFKEDNEFIMGSRFNGSIEPGAMPKLHQYLGTPVTTWILNVLYSSKFSDIHCGMRGITTDAFRRMNMQSQSWEYASEMVIQSIHMQLKTAEVPVHFLKDRNGRTSHHRRSGWTSPWKAAWINLKAMFIYGVDFFTIKPGVVALLLGLLLTVPQTLGPNKVGPLSFSLYWMIIGGGLALLGIQSIFIGLISRGLYDLTRVKINRLAKKLSYTRTVLFSAAGCFMGILLTIPIVRSYLSNDLSLPDPSPREEHMAIMGIFTMLASFSAFTFTLFVHAVRSRLARDS